MESQSSESRFFFDAVKWSEQGQEFVQAIVVETSGSTPRNAGAKMLVAHNETKGTLGGGKAEHMVINTAREMLLQRTKTQLLTIALDDTDMPSCGGHMKVFLEALLCDRRCLIVGAGHVAEAMVPLLLKTGFHVVIADSRQERLELPAFSATDKIDCPFSELKDHLPETDDMDILVMTPDHRYDFEVTSMLVSHGWRSLGIMGSVRKRDDLKKKLLTLGAPKDAVSRIRIPIGLNIGAETPEEIAVSVVAELIQMRALPDKLAKW